MAKLTKTPTRERTSEGLRDVLFDEIAELRTGKGDARKSMAVANLAKQIINVAKVEMDFHAQMHRHAQEGSEYQLGSLQLGKAPVASATRRVAAR